MGGDHERRDAAQQVHAELDHVHPHHRPQAADPGVHERDHPDGQDSQGEIPDRKSTRLNSSHSQISYAVFCLKKKKKYTTPTDSTLHNDMPKVVSDESND